MLKKSAIAVCLAATVGIAHAGYKAAGGYTVQISLSGWLYARGAMGHVRNSANSIEYISCYVDNYPSATWGTCSAKDANGTAVVCNIPNGLYSSALNLGTDSFVQFYWDSNGNCTEIQSINGSQFAPKQL